MASPIFLEFINKYTQSSSADEYRKWGESLLGHSGHFTSYLFEGNVWFAINHADAENKVMLHELLFPGFVDAILKAELESHCADCECVHQDDIDPSDYCNEGYE